MKLTRAGRWGVLGVSTVAVTIAAAIAGVPAGAAEGTVYNEGSALAVDGSYIVVLKNTAVNSQSVDGVSRRMASSYRGQVEHTYRNALRGFSAKMTHRQARRLAADPSVAFVEQDQAVRAFETQPNPPSWGLDRIDQRNLPLNSSYTFPNTASNVTAFIIDTGILISHTTFGGRARHGRDLVDNDADATDCNGHGTHVAGTVGGSQFGVAKAVRLVAVRVLDCTGSGSNAGVIAGIDWVTANHSGPSVANMSLGGGPSTAVDNAVTRSIASGVSYAIAAGNSNGANACNFSPARTPNAITVGATQISDARAGFSNTGPCLDIFAPGQGITSAWIGSNSATRTISGTSMAAPHVAGAAALILGANGALTPQQVRDTMVNNATANVVGNAGSGSPNRLLFVGSGGTPPPPPPPPPGCGPFTNAGNVNIPDSGAAVTSAVTASGCSGNASSASSVEVHIEHTWRGDLVVDLLAPDGTAYRLKGSNINDSADDVHATFPVNLSSEVRNGTWRLRVQDVFAQDVGFIDTWTLRI